MKETQDPWAITDDVEQLAAQVLAEERADKAAWLRHQREQAPLYPPTREPGTFAGLFGHPTGAGARIVPYYTTAGGVHFYRYQDPTSQQLVTKTLDVDKLSRERTALFYSDEAFLGDGEPSPVPPQAGTSPKAR